MKKCSKLLIALSQVLIVSGAITSCKDNPSDNEEKARVLLADMNKENYQIVTPTNPSATIANAANEIALYYSKITGKEMRIINELEASMSLDSTYISLGDTTLFANAENSHGKIDLSSETLYGDGFTIFTHGKNVIINSCCDRGILYGAYEFIEETLGVRYLSYKYIHVPSLKENDPINVYSYDKVYIPAYEQRAYLNTAVFNRDHEYTAHMRFNTDYCEQPAYLGGSSKWCQYKGDTSHTMTSIVPLNDYVTGLKDSAGYPIIQDEYKGIFAHTGSGDNIYPKFFQNGFIDYCFSNGVNEDGSSDDDPHSLVNITVESLKNFMTQYPDAEYFMIGQADVPTGCPCDICNAATAKYARSGIMIRFVNAVSRKIKAWLASEGSDRQIKFVMFAYQYNVEPPLDENDNLLDPTCMPDENVYIRNAMINATHYYSLTDPRQTGESATLYLKWAKITPRQMSWTYHASFGDSFWYYPTTQAMVDNFKIYHETGLTYQMAQSSYYEYNYYHDDLEAYVFSKLAWDYNQDVTDLRDEFLTYNFGEAAAPYIIEWHNMLEDRYVYLESIGVELLNHPSAYLKTEYWPYEFMEKANNLWNDALIACQNDDTLKPETKAQLISNIRSASLTPKWMRLENYANYAGVTSEDVMAVASEWITLADEFGVKKYAEGTTYTLQAIKEKYGF